VSTGKLSEETEGQLGALIVAAVERFLKEHREASLA
jgi:hypothetical protein